jgi:hypothetical protein
MLTLWCPGWPPARRFHLAPPTAIILLFPTAGDAKEFPVWPPMPAINVLLDPDSASWSSKAFHDDQEDRIVDVPATHENRPDRAKPTEAWQLKIHPDGRRICVHRRRSEKQIWAPKISCQQR